VVESGEEQVNCVKWNGAAPGRGGSDCPLPWGLARASVGIPFTSKGMHHRLVREWRSSKKVRLTALQGDVGPNIVELGGFDDFLECSDMGSVSESALLG